MGEDRILKVLKKMESNKGGDLGQIHVLNKTEVQRVPTISTGILSLDIASGGGYPQGRIVEIAGNEGGGKTSVAIHAMAETQKQGGLCAFADCEHALDVSLCDKLGVDMGKVLFTQPDNGEQAWEFILAVAEQLKGGDFIVIDSIAAMTPQVLLDGDMIDRDKLGAHASLVTKGINRLKTIVGNSGVTVFCTNQLRDNVGVMYGSPTKTTGGQALKFYASQRYDIKRGKQIKQGDVVVGFEVTINVIKNKVAPPFRKAVTSLIFGEGIAPHVDVFNMGVTAGLVQKSGSWYNYAEQRLGQGIPKSMDTLKAEPELLAKIREDVLRVYGLNT